MRDKQNHPLKKAREVHNLSQLLLAEEVHLSQKTIWNAEHNIPISAYCRRQLCAYFQKTSEELGLVNEESQIQKSDDSPTRLTSTNLHAEQPVRDGYNHFDTNKHITLASSNETMPIDCATWFGLKQTQIATIVNQWKSQAVLSDELQTVIDQEIRAFDTIKPLYDKDEYTLSRRQALVAIAGLPLALLSLPQLKGRIEVAAEEILPECAASITACWYLSKANDLPVVEHVLPVYLQKLETFVQQPSRYQKRAAHIASQGHQLALILAGHQLNMPARIAHCQRAVHYSHTAEDTNLLVAALTKLGTTLYYGKQPAMALQAYQEAGSYSDKATALLQGSLYVKLAVVYAQCGREQEARQNLELAHALFPEHPEHDPAFLYADCGSSSLYLWEGLTYLELDEPEQAAQTFSQVGGLNPANIASERNRLEIINHQAEAAVALRDQERFRVYFQEGLQGANKLGSEKRRREAIDIYEQARKVWPHEKHLRELADLFAK